MDLMNVYCRKRDANNVISALKRVLDKEGFLTIYNYVKCTGMLVRLRIIYGVEDDVGWKNLNGLIFYEGDTRERRWVIDMASPLVWRYSGAIFDPPDCFLDYGGIKHIHK